MQLQFFVCAELVAYAASVFWTTSAWVCCGRVVSELATNKCGEERNCVAVMDVKSAFLYGRVRRPIIIEVHTEDPRSQLDGVLAKLVGSL